MHVTEMSWTKRITKPGEVLNVGDEVDAVVLGIQKEDQKISLGLRQLDVNPWDMATHNYPPGAHVRGKIATQPLMVLLLNLKKELMVWFMFPT